MRDEDLYDPWTCPKCGFEVPGIRETCPECGYHEFLSDEELEIFTQSMYIAERMTRKEEDANDQENP